MHKHSDDQQDKSDLQTTLNKSDKHPVEVNSLQSTTNHSHNQGILYSIVIQYHFSHLVKILPKICFIQGLPKPALNNTKSESDQSVDIAEITRRQLQRLGVELDRLGSNDTTLR